MLNEDVIDNKCVEVTTEDDWNNLKAVRITEKNCDTYEGKTCVSCKKGFILVDEVCIKIIDAQLRCDFN